VVKEIGSGVNDARPKFLALLEDPSIGILIIEHQDRAARFGFRYIESLFRVQGRMLEVVHQAENDQEDLLPDLASMISALCARLYGQRRAKRTTDMIVEQLQAETGEEDATR
jgi:putative resolvase